MMTTFKHLFFKKIETFEEVGKVGEIHIQMHSGKHFFLIYVFHKINLHLILKPN